jgi:1-phosphofructokinase family hexose kinase
MNKKILTLTLNPAVDFTVEVPGFRSDAVNRAVSSRRDAGGKGVNTAAALSGQGLEAGVTGFLGRGNRDIFIEHFEKFGLKDEFVYIDGITREGIKITDPEKDQTTDINFKGFTVADEDVALLARHFRKIASGYGFLIMSGSLPVGVDEDIYAEFAKTAKEAGLFVAVDTIGRPLRLAVDSECVDLIKPNLGELLEIFGEDDNSDPDTLAGGLLDKVGMIALSMGGEGSRLYTKQDIYQASAPPVKVKSTVGAGDTFLAGFIAGLAGGEPPEACLRKAAAWAASKLTKYGAGCSKSEPPDNFIDHVKIERLS